MEQENSTIELVKRAIRELQVEASGQCHIVDLDGLLEQRSFIGSKSTIYKYVHRGQIPCSKRGKKLYFDLREIDKWLLANRKETVTKEVDRVRRG